MKILLANGVCRFGGVTTFLLSLRSALNSLGHECELFFFDRGVMAGQAPEAGLHFGNLGDYLRLVDRLEADVVHGNNVDWPLGISAARQLGARLVVTAHKVRPDERAYGWSYRTCDGFATVAGWIKNDLQPYTDVPIQVIPNGIDMSRFHPVTDREAGAPIVAWVGRGGSLRKRLDAFAAIAPALHDAGLRLWVIDPHGPEKVAAMLPDAVRTLQPLAEFWGSVSFEKVPDLYHQIAASGGCVVSTATDEGLVLLEAQACGCLVVAGDVPGNNGFVSPTHGGTLFPLDIAPADLASLVADTLRDRTAVGERQRAAAEYVRDQFSVERMAERYLRLYTGGHAVAEQDLLARVRARLRLSPLVDHSGYVGWRWSVGVEQYECSRRLAETGDWHVASAAARASFAMSPTIYAKPRRLGHLIGAHLRRHNFPRRAVTT